MHWREHWGKGIRFSVIKLRKEPKNAGALPLDKTSPRGIMKIQKGAVDLTVGPLVEQKC